jgi:hypothetical protein
MTSTLQQLSINECLSCVTQVVLVMFYIFWSAVLIIVVQQSRQTATLSPACQWQHAAQLAVPMYKVTACGPLPRTAVHICTRKPVGNTRIYHLHIQKLIKTVLQQEALSPTMSHPTNKQALASGSHAAKLMLRPLSQQLKTISIAAYVCDMRLDADSTVDSCMLNILAQNLVCSKP